MHSKQSAARHRWLSYVVAAGLLLATGTSWADARSRFDLRPVQASGENQWLTVSRPQLRGLLLRAGVRPQDTLNYRELSELRHLNFADRLLQRQVAWQPNNPAGLERLLRPEVEYQLHSGNEGFRIKVPLAAELPARNGKKKKRATPLVVKLLRKKGKPPMVSIKGTLKRLLVDRQSGKRGQATRIDEKLQLTVPLQLAKPRDLGPGQEVSDSTVALTLASFAEQHQSESIELGTFSFETPSGLKGTGRILATTNADLRDDLVGVQLRLDLGKNRYASLQGQTKN